MASRIIKVNGGCQIEEREDGMFVPMRSIQAAYAPNRFKAYKKGEGVVCFPTEAKARAFLASKNPQRPMLSTRMEANCRRGYHA